MNEDMTDGPEEMELTTLDLAAIIENHPAHEAEEVMSGLMRFEQVLREAVDRIQAELAGQPSPTTIFEAMNDTLEYALRFGAIDLLEVSERSHKNFAPLLEEPETGLGGAAAADTLVFINIAEQTRVAVLTLFHASMLFGYAPNGKKLPID